MGIFKLRQATSASSTQTSTTRGLRIRRSSTKIRFASLTEISESLLAKREVFSSLSFALCLLFCSFCRIALGLQDGHNLVATPTRGVIFLQFLHAINGRVMVGSGAAATSVATSVTTSVATSG